MSEIGPILALGLLSLIPLLIGYRKGFFHLGSIQWPVPLSLLQLLGGFAIYFFASIIINNAILVLWRKRLMLHYTFYSNWFNFALSFLVFLLLWFYFVLLPKNTRAKILRRTDSTYSFFEDLGGALYTWIIAFPLVYFFNQVLEGLVAKLFKVVQLPEQIAVKFLKATFEDPLYFFLAVISVVVLAPLVEETLFRGFLQTYIRQHLGRGQAILISSVCFALFHYASGQGSGNIAIIISLFIFALFLGFLYEKRGSLLAPMLLHASFNAVSVFSLYFFGSFPLGI